MAVPDRAARLEAFRRWATERGITTPKCEIRTSIGNGTFGRGVVATDDIRPGEVAISVPQEVVFLPDSSSFADLIKNARLCHGHYGKETCGLVIALVAESLLKSKSPFCEYLQILEPFQDHPLLWKKEELRWLQGTSTLQHLCRGDPSSQFRVDPKLTVDELEPLPANFLEWYFLVAAPFIHENRWMFSGESDQRIFNLFRWAACTAASYSYEIGDDRYQAFVPMWDMVNHACGKENVMLNLDQDKGRFEMVATKPISEGEQLIVSYGTLPNSEILRRYAFVDDGGDANAIVEITVDDVVSVVNLTTPVHQRLNYSEMNSRVQLLFTLKLVPEAEDASKSLAGFNPYSSAYVIDRTGKAPPEMIEATRILMLPRERYSEFVSQLKRVAYIGAHRGDWGAEKLTPDIFLPEHFMKALKLIGEHKFGGYSDGFAHCPRMLSKARQKLAQAIVLEELQCLNAFRKWVENNENEIKGMPHDFYKPDSIAPCGTIDIQSNNSSKIDAAGA